jgi:hypothetical protein
MIIGIIVLVDARDEHTPRENDDVRTGEKITIGSKSELHQLEAPAGERCGRKAGAPFFK